MTGSSFLVETISGLAAIANVKSSLSVHGCYGYSYSLCRSLLIACLQHSSSTLQKPFFRWEFVKCVSHQETECSRDLTICPPHIYTELATVPQKCLTDTELPLTCPHWQDGVVIWYKVCIRQHMYSLPCDLSQVCGRLQNLYTDHKCIVSGFIEQVGSMESKTQLSSINSLTFHLASETLVCQPSSYVSICWLPEQAIKN